MVFSNSYKEKLQFDSKKRKFFYFLLTNSHDQWFRKSKRSRSKKAIRSNISNNGLAGIEARFSSQIGLNILQLSINEDINPGFSPKRLSFRHRSPFGSPGHLYIDGVYVMDEVGNKTYIYDSTISVPKSDIHATQEINMSQVPFELLKNRIIFGITIRPTGTISESNKAVLYLDDIIFYY